MQAAVEVMPFDRRMKKHNLCLLVDYFPIKLETESQTSSEQAETIWKDVWLLKVLLKKPWGREQFCAT